MAKIGSNLTNEKKPVNSLCWPANFFFFGSKAFLLKNVVLKSNQWKREVKTHTNMKIQDATRLPEFIKFSQIFK